MPKNNQIIPIVQGKILFHFAILLVFGEPLKEPSEGTIGVDGDAVRPCWGN
jgi:hypothetical protein